MRKPSWRPPHGWDDFAYEILKIVLGVLIALGAGDAVDTWHWQGEVASTREALAGEIAEAASYALDRVAVDSCLRGRLVHLGEALRQPGPWKGDPFALRAAKGMPTQRFGLPRAYAAPVRYWPKAIWESVLPSGVLGHMSSEDRQTYSAIYRQIELMRDAQDKESALAPQLGSLAYDQPLDAEQRSRALTTIIQLDSLNNLIATIAREMLPAVRAIGVTRSPDRLDQINRFPPIQRKLRGPCVTLVRVLP